MSIYNDKPWNRSSAHIPEVIAIINAATSKAVQSAVVEFSREISGVDLSDDERAEILHQLGERVAEGIAKEMELLKHRSLTEIKSFAATVQQRENQKCQSK